MKTFRVLFSALFIAVFFAGCGGGAGSGGGESYTLSLTEGGENTLLLTLTGTTWKADVADIAPNNASGFGSLFIASSATGDIMPIMYQTHRTATRESDTELKVVFSKLGGVTGSCVLRIWSNFQPHIHTFANTPDNDATRKKWAIGVNTPVTIDIK